MAKSLNQGFGKDIVRCSGVVLVAWLAFDWFPGLFSEAVPGTSEAFALFHDEGAILYAMSEVARGARAYEEAFWNYGPLPLATLVQSTGLFGEVSLETFEKHQQSGYFIRSILLLLLIKRILGLKLGVLVWFVVGMGWSYGGRPATPHESVILLILALLWRPPASRSLSNLALVGALFGALQWVKFGTAFFAGFAWVLIDLLWQTNRQRACVWIVWLKQMVWIFLFFILVEGGRVLHAFITLPPEHAALSILPVYFLSWYDSYTGEAASRWPTFKGWAFFWGTQFPALAGLAGITAMLVLIIAKRTSSAAAWCFIRPAVWGAAVLGLFYVLGALFFFQHVWNMYLYRWTLLPGVAVLVGLLKSPYRWVVLLLLVPSALLIPLSAYRHASGAKAKSPGGLTEFTFPNGQSLWLSEDEGIAALRVVEWAESLEVEAAADGKARANFVMMPNAAGLAFYAGLSMPTRHSWLFPGSVRDFEQETTMERFLLADGCIMKLPPEEAGALSPEQTKATLDALLKGVFPADTLRRRFINACESMTHLGNGWFVAKIRPRS